MRHKLLLADDSVTIQKVIELTFADEDIEVIAVSNGKQAMAVAPIEKPDIVLADVGMPEHDGYEVAAFIKRTASLSHVPVLLLTGAFEPIDEGRAKAAGCDGILVKPFEPQMVITRVKDLIAGKRPATALAGAAPSLVPPRPAAPAPAPATDEYFTRLDAALGARPADVAAPKEAPRAAAADIASELSQWQPPAASVAAPAPTPVPSAPSAPTPVVAAAAPPPAVSARAPSLAEAFAALLAAEQGKVAPPPSVNDEALREEVIEQVTRRVIERIGDDTVRQVVVDIAERLVREEIERIKSQAR